MLAMVQNTNADLVSFKGIGKITLTSPTRTRTERVGWIGLDDERIRIEILGPTGPPVASFASDGQYFYLNLRAEKQFYRKYANAESFNDLFGVPVMPSDLVSLLKGRIPIRPHVGTNLFVRSGNDGYLLGLTRKWRTTIQELVFDDRKQKVMQVDMYKPGKTLIYRAQLENRRRVGAIEVPFRLILTADTGDRLQLDIDRYWTNVSVDPSVFILRPEDG